MEINSVLTKLLAKSHKTNFYYENQSQILHQLLFVSGTDLSNLGGYFYCMLTRISTNCLEHKQSKAVKNCMQIVELRKIIRHTWGKFSKIKVFMLCLAQRVFAD